MRPVEINHLSKIYKGKKGRRVEALVDFSLEIESGEVIGFLGPNGAGKSTTIKTLLGLIRPSSGSAKLFGIPVSERESRKKVGYLPENPSFYDFLTARQYLAMVGRSFGMSRSCIVEESAKVLDLLDLTSSAKRQIHSFSKGMVQRLGLAQTLLHDPDLYVLDEPMSGLDPQGRVLVKQIMLDLKRRGKTIFFSTHVTNDVEAVCDRVAVISAGQLRAMNRVRDLLEKGVEGYAVQFSGAIFNDCDGFRLSSLSGDLTEAFVPKEELNRFMEILGARRGQVQLIETHRRDLEKFFLETIHSEMT